MIGLILHELTIHESGPHGLAEIHGPALVIRRGETGRVPIPECNALNPQGVKAGTGPFTQNDTSLTLGIDGDAVRVSRFAFQNNAPWYVDVVLVVCSAVNPDRVTRDGRVDRRRYRRGVARNSPQLSRRGRRRPAASLAPCAGQAARGVKTG